MAVKLDSTAKTRAYSDGILARANHHGRDVQTVLPSLVGYVQTFANGMEAHAGRSFSTGTVAWAEFGKHKRRIAFRYNHGTRKVEARERTVRGRLLKEFDNSTPHSELFNFFTTL